MKRIVKVLLIFLGIALFVLGKMGKTNLWTGTGIFSKTNFYIAIFGIVVALIIIFIFPDNNKDSGEKKSD